ncbi:MAG: hypothetical protein RR357_04870 [Clostridia bacterium]
MRDLIGKNLIEAKRILQENGITDIEIVYNNNKRETVFDCELVVKADILGSVAKLTVSRFLVKI